MPTPVAILMTEQRRFGGVVSLKDIDPLKMEEIGKKGRVIKGIIEVSCYESHLHADEAPDWDICKLIQESGDVKLVRGVPYLQLNPRNIEKLISDDEGLYFKFKTPTNLTASREGRILDVDPRSIKPPKKLISPGKRWPPGHKLKEIQKRREVTKADPEYREEALDTYRKFIEQEKEGKVAERKVEKEAGETPIEEVKEEEAPEETPKEIPPTPVKARGGRWMEPTTRDPSISLFNRAVKAADNIPREMEGTEQAEILEHFKALSELGETGETFNMTKDFQVEVKEILRVRSKWV
jgi:hypothetical protein